MGQHEMNGVIKLNNGYLSTLIEYVSDDDLKKYTNKVTALNSYLQERGTELVFAMTPYTTDKYDPQLPTGEIDYGNDDADRMMNMLENAGIDTIDFRETMHEDGINHYDMMYKTDHHWNTAAGLYAYGKLEQYIADVTKCNADERVSDPSQYTITKYKNWHLGSRGQRTGKYFAGMDDFDLYLPNFETVIQNDAGKIGNMQDLVINVETLENRNYTSRYTYDWVLEGSLGHYKNLNCENDIKILIITDSFGKAVNPYLIMGFNEISYVYNGNSSNITPEYIEAYDPDVVILLYYTQCAVSADSYNFRGFD